MDTAIAPLMVREGRDALSERGRRTATGLTRRKGTEAANQENLGEVFSKFVDLAQLTVRHEYAHEKCHDPDEVFSVGDSASTQGHEGELQPFKLRLPSFERVPL